TVCGGFERQMRLFDEIDEVVVADVQLAHEEAQEDHPVPRLELPGFRLRACLPSPARQPLRHERYPAVVLECGDLEKRPAFREYARLWNYEDYASALQLDQRAFLPAREDQDGAEH